MRPVEPITQPVASRRESMHIAWVSAPPDYQVWGFDKSNAHDISIRSRIATGRIWIETLDDEILAETFTVKSGR